MTVTVTEKVVVSIEVDWVALAKAVEEEVMAKLNDDLILWQDDMAMRAVIMHDAADGLDVCVFLADGKWSNAQDRLYKMDTASREWVWDWVEKHSCNGFFDILCKQGA
jgi:hypothetical protein